MKTWASLANLNIFLIAPKPNIVSPNKWRDYVLANQFGGTDKTLPVVRY